MFAPVALLTTLAIAAPHRVATPPPDRPRISVWTNRGDDPYPLGEAVRVMFQTEEDGYVTVLRVDTDGRVRVLYPRAPWENNLARGGRVYEVRDAWGFSGFRADAYPGLGYLFAVVAAEPFNYDPIENEQRWNYELVADGGRIRGDPYAALTELAARILPDGSQDWDYDIAPYHVQRHYDYPRFLCFDCHAYAGFPTWNPYDYTCVRFRVVVFDDPYYYPYRWYGGTRAVIRRPQRLEPRFIFRDRGAADAFFTRIPERPVNDDRRRSGGVRGRDIGSPGTVPPPRAVTPRRPPDFSEVRDPGARGAPRNRAGPPDRTVPRGQSPRDQERSGPPATSRRPERTGAAPTRRSPSTEQAQPRRPPRAEPSRGGQRDGGKRGEPELRRRKPS